MGMSKGGIPGRQPHRCDFCFGLEDALGPVGVPLSVGLLLPVLISTDLTATIVYRKRADGTISFVCSLSSCWNCLGWWVFDYFQGGEGAFIVEGLIESSCSA